LLRHRVLIYAKQTSEPNVALRHGTLRPRLISVLLSPARGCRVRRRVAFPGGPGAQEPVGGIALFPQQCLIAWPVARPTHRIHVSAGPEEGVDRCQIAGCGSVMQRRESQLVWLVDIGVAFDEVSGEIGSPLADGR